MFRKCGRPPQTGEFEEMLSTICQQIRSDSLGTNAIRLIFPRLINSSKPKIGAPSKNSMLLSALTTSCTMIPLALKFSSMVPPGDFAHSSGTTSVFPPPPSSMTLFAKHQELLSPLCFVVIFFSKW